VLKSRSQSNIATFSSHLSDVLSFNEEVAGTTRVTVVTAKTVTDLHKQVVERGESRVSVFQAGKIQVYSTCEYVNH
jgi:hypothetical protein